MTNKFLVGLRTNNYNITWPFVICHLEPEKLILKPAFGPENIVFYQSIVKLELYSGVFTPGVKLVVITNRFEHEIIIWIKSRQIELYNSIRERMDLNLQDTLLKNEDSNADENRYNSDNIDLSGFPLRNWFVGTFILFWNIPYILLYFSKYGEALSIEVKSSYRLIHGGLTVMILFLLLISSSFQKLTLKRGRSISEIRRILILVILLLCILMLNTYTLYF